MRSTKVWVIAAILAALGIGVMLYKHFVLEFPLSPDTKYNSWYVETRLDLYSTNPWQPGDKPVLVNMQLPHASDTLALVDENIIARRFGFAGSFMAKPYDLFNGNGMHMHFSVLDQNGDNIFDDGTDAGSERLRHAVAGCLRAMPGSTLLFAPHENSYDRLVPNAHAPTGIGWVNCGGRPQAAAAWLASAGVVPVRVPYMPIVRSKSWSLP